jgi:N-acetylglucosaminyldiphosphoundecaprenol N-acetyl-beta-D-mannosaminyltransferase
MTTRAFERSGANVLGTYVDAAGWDECLERITRWAVAHESRCVCACNVHTVVTAQQDPSFARTITGADLVAPDGAPIAWCLRRLGYREQERIPGPDLMARLCERAAREGLAVFLYGCTPGVLVRLRARLASRFPGLRIAGSLAPPFRALSAEEDERIVRTIRRSGARIVFVALGCPKQEAWIMAHRGRIDAVMIGVGAAFGFHAGTLRRAPSWMRRAGLEWLHRLCTEPARLWRRYLLCNTYFAAGLLGQMLRGRLRGS